MTEELTPLVSIRLLGDPVPYRYALAGAVHLRQRIVDDKRYAAWKKDAVARIQRHMVRGTVHQVRVPVVFCLDAWMERPARGVQAFATIEGQGVPVPEPWRTSTGRVPCLAPGDTTNLGKAAEDAVVQGGLLLDDRLCVRTEASKGYAAVGEQACVEVRLYSALDWYAWAL